MKNEINLEPLLEKGQGCSWTIKNNNLEFFGRKWKIEYYDSDKIYCIVFDNENKIWFESSDVLSLTDDGFFKLKIGDMALTLNYNLIKKYITC